MQPYDKKTAEYFSNVRHDILPLVPSFSHKVMEVGCGNGATLKYLKENQYCSETHGIEMFPAVGEQARLNVDRLWIGDAEKIIHTIEAEEYDLILCLDVLEHMLDPWQFADRAAMLLKPGGCLIASIPNMRTAVVLAKLLFKGRFRYHDAAGIMDRTHLRYFTRESAMELMNRKPLQTESVLPSPNARGSKSNIANILTAGMLRDFFTEQFLIRSKRADGQSQPNQH
jgi:2-polyprenyl-3-methyl-5-hydroxy-6-metoxy-1,4-benzoquinol methylase